MATLVLVVVAVVALAAVATYLVLATILTAVRRGIVGVSALIASPQVPLVVDPPRWTALDDQQVARFLKQSPP
jgi:hypothetical protein